MNPDTKYKMTDVAKVVWQMTGVKIGKQSPALWRSKGKRSYTGRLVFLHAEMILRAYYTTPRWIEQFMKELEK